MDDSHILIAFDTKYEWVIGLFWQFPDPLGLQSTVIPYYKWSTPVNISGYISMSNKCLTEVTWEKYQAFTVPIHRHEKKLELGTWCLISEALLYFSGVIHLIGRWLIGQVFRYIQLNIVTWYAMHCDLHGYEHSSALSLETDYHLWIKYVCVPVEHF